MASLKGFGEHVFYGHAAAPYLAAQGLPLNTLETPDWTHNGNADKVTHFLFCFTPILFKSSYLFAFKILF
jgi:hypothetical protein